MSGESAETRYDEICVQLRGFRLPAWDEIPDLDYYMDQVLSLIERYLGDYPGFEQKGLTASMVNNYVKQGLLQAPVKKRYTRAHLARLIMICVLKTTLPIASVKCLLEAGKTDEKAFYNRFTALFGEANEDTAAALAQRGIEAAAASACSAALRAQAERAVAIRLCGEAE